jgi:cyclophilin family peptidyl-prolyl cis-trans isomerase
MYHIERRKKATSTGLKVGGAVAALVVVAIILALTVGKSDDKKKVAAPTATTLATAAATPTSAGPPPPFVYGTGACAAADGSSPVTKKFTVAPKLCIDPTKTYTATFDTTEGTMVVALDTKRTPGTTNNFVTLARYHYYDGSLIFRTDTSIDIIQGGGKTNSDDPGYTIPDEGTPFTYSAGDIVMANTGQPNSGGAQFFIGTGPNISNLNAQGSYVTFGKLTTGLDIAQKIIGLNKDDPSSQLGGAPSRTVTVTKVTIAET